MDIEIVVIGESSKWVLNQSRIRIGQDPSCEVNLPAGRYPALSAEHVALDVANGAVRLYKGMRSSGETYLNGHPADSGAAVRSGDVLRLGAGGPELRIRVLDRDASAVPAEHEQTRMMYEPAAATHEATRVMHEPTRVISGPAATTYSPAPPPAAGAGGRQSYSNQAAYGGSASAYVPPAASAPPRRPDAGPAQVSYAPPRVQQAPAQAAAPPAESADLRKLEGKLKSMRMILLVNLALVALLCAWVYMQGQELAQTHKDLQALRVQAQSAMGALTPSLDARLSVFEKRMDAMDAKVATAQDRMVKGMDEQAKLAEDRLVNRMNIEIPAMLDKYVAKKMAEIKH
jgi:ribosomal 50S subunit-recycling heat shock protein